MNKLHHQHEHLANKDKKNERNFWFYMIAYILKGHSIFSYIGGTINIIKFFPHFSIVPMLANFWFFSHVQSEAWDDHSNALILLSVNYFRVVSVIQLQCIILLEYSLPGRCQFFIRQFYIWKKKSWYWLAFDKLIKTFGFQNITVSVFPIER